MIVKNEIVEKIRTRINSLVTSGTVGSFIGLGTERSRALEIAVREAFAGIVEMMAFSDEEEEAVQAIEAKKANGQVEAYAQIDQLLKVLRTRHPKRVVFKSAGQILHEAYHANLNGLGKSKYGNGCWKDLSAEVAASWEKAAVELANAVTLNKVQLKPSVALNPFVRRF